MTSRGSVNTTGRRCHSGAEHQTSEEAWNSLIQVRSPACPCPGSGVIRVFGSKKVRMVSPHN